MYTDVIMGSGSFQVTVQLMNGTVPLPHNYSLSSEEAVVVDVSLNTSSEDIKVVINKCWATPTRNPGDSYSHIFLENRSASSPFLLFQLATTSDSPLALSGCMKDRGRIEEHFLHSIHQWDIL